MNEPTKEQWMAADALARKLGYDPANVQDMAELIAPFLAAPPRPTPNLEEANEPR